MRALPRDAIITVIIAVIAFFLLHTTIQSYVVIGSSMEPTVAEKERLLINKLAYFFNPPERGDIIVFRPPSNQQFDYIKRVIAVPGDTVEIRDYAVYVNGKRLAEPYIKAAPYYNLSPQQILQGNYFVLGDNRNDSNDSHNGWTIPRRNISGKAWLRIWPPTNWGVLHSFPPDSPGAASEEKIPRVSPFTSLTTYSLAER